MRLACIGRFAAASILLGCSDSFTPSIGNVAGSYTSTTFLTTDSTGTTDQLAAGTTFTISLAANGTTTGRLFVPGAGAGGGDLDADMAGTWTLTGTTVQFAQTADTFVRDMPFRAESNRLRGEAVFGATTVRVVLTK